MARDLLLDTSALVSLLDRAQERHSECAEFFHDWTGSVVTTEAVLTEATHLLSHVSGGRAACLRFVLGGGAMLVPTDTPALRRCERLIAQFADLPMDYADATLVVLADELDSDMVFTLDRDFDVYRRRDVRPLRRVPQ